MCEATKFEFCAYGADDAVAGCGDDVWICDVKLVIDKSSSSLSGRKIKNLRLVKNSFQSKQKNSFESEIETAKKCTKIVIKSTLHVLCNF